MTETRERAVPAPPASSLRNKVPLFIGLGVALILTVWTWISYNGMRNITLEAGRQHLASVTTQFATAYATNARSLPRSLGAIAGNPAIARFLQQPSPATREEAVAHLSRTTVGPNMRLEVFSLDGTPLLGVHRGKEVTSGERHEELDDEFRSVLSGASPASFAPLRMLSDTVTIPVVGAILIDSQPAGFIAAWIRVAARPQEIELFSKLIGNDARPYLGNVRGDIWSDFTGAARPLPIPAGTDDDTLVRYTTPDGVSVVAMTRPVEGTPYRFAMEMEEAGVVAAADQFLKKSIAIGLLVLLIATITAWYLSTRITQPLHTLTTAALEMAAGNYAERVHLDRDDELGVLAKSFNAMAAQVSSAQRQLEAKVAERTRQLNERNEELETFGHSISHDLRAPLRAMHGFSQALLEDSGDQLDETGKDYARRIAAAAGRMDRLTQDLLAFSKISRADITLVDVDLDAVTRDAIGQLEADIATKGARVEVHGPLPRVRANRATLEQTIANLVSNALKFVVAGTPPEIALRTDRVGPNVRLWIEDNGIGIDPVHHQRIFQVFERLHNDQQFPGTGIGLAIVRKAIDRMGGRVGVEANPSGGSRFWIEVPSAETTE